MIKVQRYCTKYYLNNFYKYYMNNYFGVILLKIQCEWEIGGMSIFSLI